jgi:hypothetical protein
MLRKIALAVPSGQLHRKYNDMPRPIYSHHRLNHVYRRGRASRDPAVIVECAADLRANDYELLALEIEANLPKPEPEHAAPDKKAAKARKVKTNVP